MPCALSKAQIRDNLHKSCAMWQRCCFLIFAMAGPLFSNLDYLLFAVAALALFGAGNWAMRRRFNAALPKLVWALMFAIVAGGWWVVKWTGEARGQQIAQLVGTAAPIYARELSRLGHAALTPETRTDDPTYQTLLEATKQWMSDNPMAHDIYTLRLASGGRRVFLLDGDTDYDHDGVIAENEAGAAPGEEYDEEDAGLDRALGGQGNFDFEPITDRWGTWVSAWAPIYDAAGNLDGVVGVDYDAAMWFSQIATRRLERIMQLVLVLGLLGAAGGTIEVLRVNLAKVRVAEEQARRANDRWNLIIEQMPLAFIELTPKEEIIGWSPAAERIFGYTAAETLGQRGLELLIKPEKRADIRGMWQRLIAGSTAEGSTNENITKDGRVIVCEWTNQPVLDRNGKVVSIISLAQDVTARRSLEEQMQQAQKMQGIGMLAAGIAHDFNNILTIIQGHSELLLCRSDLPEEAMEDITRIEESAERAAALTKQLLTFSRRQPMFKRSIDLNQTVTNTAAMLRRVLGAQIRVACELGEALPAVQADSSMLDQVITNLAVNARDAMNRGGTLTLATRLEIAPQVPPGVADAHLGAVVCLSVTDTGTGIDPVLLSRIFEPFFTTKEVGQGTGLGLAAVHGIVKQHGGWITVNSFVGRGTTFDIFLPCEVEAIAKKETSATADAPATKPDPTRKTVLLVEDEPEVRHLARLTLEHGGYRVLEAGDGPTAQALWTRERDNITLLCTDMKMPNGLSGRDLAEMLLDDKPDLSVVYCSGYSVDLSAPGFCSSPLERFLPKPYFPKDLLASVGECLSPREKLN